MNYSGIEECDVLDGEGFRVSLFVSGCGKIPKCKYCQNEKAWNFNYGHKFTKDTKDYILNCMSKDYIDGISLLGGEITDNLEDGIIFDLLDSIKILYPTKSIWAWTGYKYENLTSDNHKKFLSYLDILVDGEYDYTRKDLNRAWGNSSNQRIIDVQQSLKQNKIILKEK